MEIASADFASDLLALTAELLFFLLVPLPLLLLLTRAPSSAAGS